MTVDIAGSTRLAAVIGHPVGHSLSPAIHNAAFRARGLDWVYLAFDVAAGSVAPAFAGVRALGVAGLSVTMPHKQAAAEHADELTDDARRLGAVNCVVNRNGSLVGHNTDGAGFLAALDAEIGFSARGARCVVLGGGGAARAVVLALTRAGAAQIVVVNRTPARARSAAALGGDIALVAAPEEAESMVSGADLVVNATRVGMGEPSTTDLPVVLDWLHPGQVVADLVYQPLRTPLVLGARQRGITAVNGLAMLVHQAALSFELWTGIDAPLDVMTEVVSARFASQ